MICFFYRDVFFGIIEKCLGLIVEVYFDVIGEDGIVFEEVYKKDFVYLKEKVGVYYKFIFLGVFFLILYDVRCYEFFC